MNRETFTSKTGLTAIFSILGVALGMYTATIPIATGAQTIITALIGLFLRDAVSKNAVKIDDQADKLSEANNTADTALRVAQATQHKISGTTRTEFYDRSGA